MESGQTPLGLIAGEGQLPLLVARGARATGRRVVVVALRGCADPGLAAAADVLRWRGIAQLGRWIRVLRRSGCREVVMAGRVRKSRMFGGPRWLQWLQYLPDLTSIRVWYFAARDKRNDALLGAVAEEMQRRGLTLIDSTRYIPDSLAAEGVLTPQAPPPRVLDDARFAWPLLKQVAGLDIGQSMAVKEREVIAVEAIEGTDALIERAGRLCPQGGWTLVKVAKPNQDLRFDVPTVGPQTIENLARAGAAALVIEAGRTIMLERERLLAEAARCRIAVVGMRDAAAADGVPPDRAP
ncbi:MAG: UDP-2,3-diacylglucosamine diphosphatase LpxI [Phycisphaerae bacterium]|nr:UDP-2,3-diacylglucosamine diphosphatase LpxI [Phycisphaerae bacterium]MCZ2399638.1 UDP-2,3-diacylglucosamine diphosphatase LpxI [Phycisphaerae bacterium]